MRFIIPVLVAFLLLTLLVFTGGSQVEAQLPVPVPTVTLTVPGPVETVIKEVPGPTETVAVPGPTVTVTETRNAEPAPTVTVTVTESAEPGTPTDVPSIGQVTPSDATVTPTPEPTPTPTPPVREGLDADDDVFISTPEAVGIGTGLFLLGLAGGLAGLFLAYYRGYKDSDKAEARINRRLRDDVIER